MRDPIYIIFKLLTSLIDTPYLLRQYHIEPYLIVKKAALPSLFNASILIHHPCNHQLSIYVAEIIIQTIL